MLKPPRSHPKRETMGTARAKSHTWQKLLVLLKLNLCNLKYSENQCRRNTSESEERVSIFHKCREDVFSQREVRRTKHPLSRKQEPPNPQPVQLLEQRGEGAFQHYPELPLAGLDFPCVILTEALHAIIATTFLHYTSLFFKFA